MMQPLASSDHSKSETNTNLSRTLSLTIFDENQKEISIQTNASHPIELFIPRDPTAIVPPMIHQNVSQLNLSSQSFYLHSIDFTRKNNLAISFHLEIFPFNASLAYFFVYKFKALSPFDGWTIFCPSSRDFIQEKNQFLIRMNLDLTKENLYQYFLNNEEVSSHQSIIFGLRQMNDKEFEEYCLHGNVNPAFTFNQSWNFTSDYQIRSYTSGCYYLDSNSNWQSDGLTVNSFEIYSIASVSL